MTIELNDTYIDEHNKLYYDNQFLEDVLIQIPQQEESA